MSSRLIYEDPSGIEIEDVERQANRVEINPEFGHCLVVVPENNAFSVYESGGMPGFETLGAGKWVALLMTS